MANVATNDGVWQQCESGDKCDGDNDATYEIILSRFSQEYVHSTRYVLSLSISPSSRAVVSHILSDQGVWALYQIAVQVYK